MANNEFKTKFFDKYFDITNKESDKITRPEINKKFEDSLYYDDLKKN